MATSRNNVFTTVTTQGGLFPPEFLQKICEQKSDVDGLTPEAYHLVAGRKLNEAINNAWSPLKRNWTAFKEKADALGEDDPGIGLTRDQWLLPLFQELGFGRLQRATASDIDGAEYPISHQWEHVPIHLAGWNVDTDKRQSGVAGSARMAPHSMVQEFLNRSDDHLWGIVSNGRVLRLLRDNVTMTRQAYVEFDLVAMMEGEVYSDFGLLWLLCHESRLASEQPAQCWLEKWSQAAEKEGTRLLEHLREGVEEAIQTFGSGFLAHPANQELRRVLRDGELDKQDYYRQILRLVYRLIFLFVAEDRDLLHTPDTPAETKTLYFTHYSTQRIRRLAERRRGTRHGDLWHQLQVLFDALGKDDGCERLGLNPLGSFLWSNDATPCLSDVELANNDLLEAFRSLAVTRSEGILRAVDYRNLGAEELGSIYESLLEMHPDVNLDSAVFELKVAAGNERKSSGSYYTPPSLVQCLLDSALEPVVEDRLKKIKTTEEREQALLELKVCDPACGSGHFLIAAAHRIAKHLARVRTEETEPTPEAVRHALRDVVSRCIYGVDINPMAVELCRVSLWMEAMEPGKPLGFLDHHIKCGNSLLGTTPALLSRGIPDAAFKSIEGDDKKICTALKKQNKEERDKGAMGDLFAHAAAEWSYQKAFDDAVAEVDSIADDDLQGVDRKQAAYEEFLASTSYVAGKRLHDAWCAAFVCRKIENAPAITQHLITDMQRDPNRCPTPQREAIDALADQYQLFHWHIEFPDVFQPLSIFEDDDTRGWTGGFDCMVGNPPWERVKLQEKEWFAERLPEIAKAPNTAARRRSISALREGRPELFAAFQSDLRAAEGMSALLCNSGGCPLCGRGDVNLYAVFAESMRRHVGTTGRMGAVLPTGIATDDTTKYFFQDLIEQRSLVSLFDFENRRAIFPGVHRSYRFCLFTSGGLDAPAAEKAEFVFFALEVSDTSDSSRRFTLTPEDIVRLSPETHTCPVFRSRRDANIVTGVYHRLRPLCAHDGSTGWKLNIFQKMIDVTIHAKLCHFGADPGDGDWVPVYEGRLFHHFNHRFATYAGVNDADLAAGKPRPMTDTELANPAIVVSPSIWITHSTFIKRLGNRQDGAQWFLSMRYVTNTTNERTVIAGIRPFVPSNNKLVTLFADADAADKICLGAELASFVFDYVARQKVGSTTLGGYVFRQLPLLPRNSCRRITHTAEAATACPMLDAVPRSLELYFTAWDLAALASDVGNPGPPFLWDEERRFQLRCELDAAFFHLYGIERDDVNYIMETFPIVKRKDEAKYGDYRTKLTILQMYDEMAEAMATGKPYQTHLDPPPADSSCRHPKLKLGILAYGSLINGPGEEITPKIKWRLKTKTPFGVEYGRYSGKTRGGAPTVVPHKQGEPVDAEILVLDDDVTYEEAQHMLYRREIGQVGSDKTYTRKTGDDCILVEEWPDNPCVERVLYTDFNPGGKQPSVTAEGLAKQAIDSVAKAESGKDGITYLRDNIANGINTPLTDAYHDEILKQTNTISLDEALEKVREG